ncbi:MAG: protein-L-isoaspartate(D-aspartate) O-methyltransferase [Chloroflexota bacterium]|nr:protein-L-isoaspartate(D-aspartate) O-methyltransferase [Chloroflexota bacterium]PLS79235.1 MAG: protein-L-isoaspartate O-methyltransferase [Chloroflexota bacterium]
MERESERQTMIAEQLRRRNIRDERVLQVMARVQRHRFVPEALTEQAYSDNALPIAEQQTISQPFIVALTAEALMLQGDERVLEIGTGSGYAAAVLSLLAREVWTIERFRSLAETAAARLHAEGYTNVHVGIGDGTAGWPEHAPYDAIAVAAAGPHIPQSLIEQLAMGGRLVIPVGSREEQQLVRIVRMPDGLRQDRLGPVRFVPLVGQEGWAGEPPAQQR